MFCKLKLKLRCSSEVRSKSQTAYKILILIENVEAVSDFNQLSKDINVLGCLQNNNQTASTLKV